MIEVAPRLYVGNAIDYERNIKGKEGWSVVHCAKEPYHRQAVGYKGMGCPRDDKEYLFAYRDELSRLCLNMIDAPKPEFFADAMIDEALRFIKVSLEAGDKVLCHCNQGGSRAPSLALLYLRPTDDYADMSFAEAEDVFRACYPPYDPAAGIRAYVERKWNEGPHGEPSEPVEQVRRNGRITKPGA